MQGGSHDSFSEARAGASTVLASHYQKLWDDSGTGALLDLSLFRPLPTDCAFAVGDVAVRGHVLAPKEAPVAPCTHTYLVVQATLPQPEGGSVLLLGLPIGYTKVFSIDNGTHGAITLWKPVAPEGYVALGLVVGFGGEVPSVSVVRCVHASAVAYAHVAYDPDGSFVWCDYGSGLRGQRALWWGPAGQPPSLLVHGASHYDRPTHLVPYLPGSQPSPKVPRPLAPPPQVDEGKAVTRITGRQLSIADAVEYREGDCTFLLLPATKGFLFARNVGRVVLHNASDTATEIYPYRRRDQGQGGFVFLLQAHQQVQAPYRGDWALCVRTPGAAPHIQCWATPHDGLPLFNRLGML